jgi:uncharacterized protein (DUF1800 family)
MSDRAAHIALNRFGYGARPGEIGRVARDPKGWLKAQISRSPALPDALSDLPHSSDPLRDFLLMRRARQIRIIEKRRALFRKLHQLFRREVDARAAAAIQSESPLVERMTAFWANHFTVAAKQNYITPMIGGFEREAIRPNIFGRFEDLLLASTRHPAMLLYLENFVSVGPSSRGGRIARRGLNENLAREILELHTLGVAGGYTQRDVTEFAKTLTGWSVEGFRRRGPITGRFKYYKAVHEPGTKTILGKHYGPDGAREAETVLRDLARHPSTARHIATKLARHFIADDPPQAAVDRLAGVFRRTGGDLRALTLALIDLPEVWSNPLPKVKTPFELVVSTMRAAGVQRLPRRGFVPSFYVLRQMPFRAPTPAGWPDKAEDWITPEGLARRIDWVRMMANRFGRFFDPEEVYETTIAAVAHGETKTAIDRAASRADALALTLASAEFQRR